MQAQHGAVDSVVDWTDWILFGVGWICGIAWIVGACRPLCRNPRFPAARNKAGWIANIAGKPYTNLCNCCHQEFLWLHDFIYLRQFMYECPCKTRCGSGRLQ